MWRTVLTPRWLGGLVLVLLAMATCVLLGLWQLSVARDRGHAEAVASAPTRPVVPVGEVLSPHAEFPGDGNGRRVTAIGTYDDAGQVLVVDRRLSGSRGSWVVTPLDVDGTGVRLAVVRGFLPDGEPVPAPPAGTVTVTGSLAPGESPAETSAVSPEGQLGSVDLSVLVNRWPGGLYNAFAFAAAESPDPLTADSALRRVPPPEVQGGLQWRNASYALQWWVFAAFVAYMWWRMVRDETRRRLEPPPSGSDDPNGPAPPDEPHEPDVVPGGSARSAHPTEVTTRA